MNNVLMGRLKSDGFDVVERRGKSEETHRVGKPSKPSDESLEEVLRSSQQVVGRSNRRRRLSQEEIANLESMLVDWTLPELAQVLLEIDRRLAVCEILGRLGYDPAASERTLHELVLSALWLFGPEYEAATYCSNLTLRAIAKKLFGRPGCRFASEHGRPDVIMKSDGYTCGAACIEGLPEDEFHCASPHRIAIVELKRGGSVLGRHDLSQADGYAQTLHEAGVVPDSYFVNVWVVGGEVGAGVGADRFLADGRRCYARVRATTFSALATAATRRISQLDRSRSSVGT